MSSSEYITAQVIQDIPLNIDFEIWQKLPHEKQSKLIEIWEYLKLQPQPQPILNSFGEYQPEYIINNINSFNQSNIIFHKYRKLYKNISSHLCTSYNATKKNRFGDYVIKINW